MEQPDDYHVHHSHDNPAAATVKAVISRPDCPISILYHISHFSVLDGPAAGWIRLSWLVLYSAQGLYSLRDQPFDRLLRSWNRQLSNNTTVIFFVYPLAELVIYWHVDTTIRIAQIA